MIENKNLKWHFDQFKSKNSHLATISIIHQGRIILHAWMLANKKTSLIELNVLKTRYLFEIFCLEFQLNLNGMGSIFFFFSLIFHKISIQ